MPDHSDGHGMSDQMRQCIQNCTECHNTCEETTSYCLRMGGSHLEAFHLRTLLDCAEACAASANFMLRGSEMHPSMCGMCAEACDRCAQSCDDFGSDPQMEACAETCRRCAESCRQMAGMKAIAR